MSELWVHHIGYVVRDIEQFSQSMPGMTLQKCVEDPLQNAKLSLFSVGAGSNVELIQPNDPSSFTWGHLEKHGDCLHHICYEGATADEIDQLLRSHKLLKIRGPIFAPLFERDVVFAVSRQRAILEFII